MESSLANWEMRIDAARQGNRDALNEIFDGLRPYFRRQAEKRLDARLSVKTSPSDIVQETFVRAFEGFAGFRGTTRGELIAWLQGILRHRLLTAQRHYRGADKRSLAREKVDSERSDVQPTNLESPHQSPSGLAIVREEIERLEEELKRLPERQEQAIRLRNELHLSFEEVGQALDCTPDAAQKLWARAVKQLSSRLKPLGESP